MYFPRTWVWLIACLVACSLAGIAHSQDARPSRSYAADSILRQSRQLLDQNEVSSALILLESILDTSGKDPAHRALLTEAYRKQFDRLQREGKLPQASQVWAKLVALQPDVAHESSAGPAQVTVHQAPAAPSVMDHMQAAEAAYQQRKFDQACECFEKLQAQGTALPAEARERFAYCKLHQVAQRLNAQKGQLGPERQQLEREVRAALELAPRLEFGQELLRRLQAVPPARLAMAVRHLDKKEQGWSVCETTHFKVFHTDPQLGEQVAQIAEATRAAVIRRWLGNEIAWEQSCQIYVHPTADSYHRQSGMPATAPGHSDYDADKNDASIIHFRRVFVRADHPHMLKAILPHEVTHVVLNGQFGRKLLPRWADEGMAVLSEPYGRIEMHLNPLPDTYRQGQALSLQELLSVDNYPSDRSKVASFYGQSVCLVEYLCSVKSPQAFVTFLRDANREGDAAALQRNYGLTIGELESRLQQWIVAQRMPTLMGQTGNSR